MLPILITFGPVTIYTFGFLLGIGFLLSAFIAWRRLSELGYQEEKIIDLILFISLFGLFFARGFYIFQNFAKFGFSPSRWFFLVRYPGLSFGGSLLGWFLGLGWFTKKEKWNFWQTHDELVFAILPFSVLTQSGSFFDGSSPGRATSLPWGLYFPGCLLKRQPVSLFATLAFLIIWIFLRRIERQWRIWDWYKSKAPGLISLVFWQGFFWTNFLLAFWRDTKLYFYWLEIGFSLGGALTALFLFYSRSGRSLKQDLSFLVKRSQNEKENEKEKKPSRR